MFKKLLLDGAPADATAVLPASKAVFTAVRVSCGIQKCIYSGMFSVFAGGENVVVTRARSDACGRGGVRGYNGFHVLQWFPCVACL